MRSIPHRPVIGTPDMTPIAIPTTASTNAPAVNADAASPPAPGSGAFDTTLRQTQAPPAAAGDTGATPDDGHAPKPRQSKDDDEDAPGASVLPVLLTAVAQTAAPPPRQAAAAPGNALPPALPSRSMTPLPSAPVAPVAPAPIAIAGLPIQRPSAPTGSTPAGPPPAVASAPDTATIPTGAAMDNPPAATLAQSVAVEATAAGGVDADRMPARSDAIAVHLAQLAGASLATTPAQVQVQAPAPQPLQLLLRANPGQPQFAPEVAQQVSWLAGAGIQKAQIQLNPPELGPIHVDITTDHDHVDVTFAVQHPQTVNALQQALPQLHDMLAQQGLNLGQASVGQQPPGQQHATPVYRNADGAAPRGKPGPESIAPWRPLRVAVPGGVDDFA